MLTQRKRQRTVEDFNQFCTFVLAYAGYIPDPQEEWWCSDGGPGDRSSSTGHSTWAYLSSPSTDDGPSQPKRDREDTGKRRKSGKKATGQREKNSKGCDSGSANASPEAKKYLPSLGRALAGNNADSDREIRANPESTPGGALLNRHDAERTGAAGLNGGPSEKNATDLSRRRGSASEEVTEEPVDLTIGGLIENLLKANRRPQGGDGAEEKRKEEGGDGAEEKRKEEGGDGAEEKRKEEEGGDGAEEKRKEEGGDGAEERERRRRKEEGGGGERGTRNANVLRLVMDKRLKGLLPYDQENGYHTDMEGHSPYRDPRTMGTSASSAAERGDTSADHSKMEEDDSWDLITCFCLKPFAGRPMIECSECATWVHLSCAKIRRAHVPDVFVCQPCRDAKQKIRRSNRPRIPSRKRFSD